MNYLNLVTGFYMQHPVINTAVIIGVLVLGWFLWTYRKTEMLLLAGTIKAEAMANLKGREKLEFALKWLMKQNFYKNSILKFIPQKVIEWLINAIFNKNKEIIEAK